MFGIEFVKSEKLDGLYRDLRKAQADLACEKERMKEVLYGQGISVNMLVQELKKTQDKCLEYERRLAVCDDARSGLGDKNRALAEENTRLREDIADIRESYAELLREHKELEEAHEILVGGLRGKEVC